MLRRFGTNYMLLLYLLDLGGSQVALRIAHDLRLLVPFTRFVPEAGVHIPVTVSALILVTFAVALPMVSLYDGRRVFRAVNEAIRVVAGVITSSLFLAGILYLSYREVPRVLFLYFVVVAIVLLLSYRIFLRVVYRAVRWPTKNPVRVLIAGAGSLGRQTAKILVSTGIAVTGFVDDDPAKQETVLDGLPVFSRLGELPDVIASEDVTDVIFALPYHAQSRLTDLLVSLWTLPIRIYTVPDFFKLGFARARMDYLGALSVIGLRDPMVDGFQRVAKRLVDLVIGTAILICALPVIAGIAVAVRLDSRGPVVFKQQRVGENGRRFMMYKFRTMAADAERRQEELNVRTSSGRVIHKRRNDPRVTRVGRVLRRFSLDELPQLLNVLRGEMSLVGPRPELPWIVAQYEPWQYQRLAVPQGMTSWYVVHDRSEIPMHLNTDADLRYVRNYSLFQDMKILWRSLSAVVRGRGAF